MAGKPLHILFSVIRQNYAPLLNILDIITKKVLNYNCHKTQKSPTVGRANLVFKLDVFFNLSSLTNSVTKIIEFSTANFTFTNNLN